MSLYAIKSAKIRHRILSPQGALVGQRNLPTWEGTNLLSALGALRGPAKRTSDGALHAGMATIPIIGSPQC